MHTSSATLRFLIAAVWLAGCGRAAPVDPDAPPPSGISGDSARATAAAATARENPNCAQSAIGPFYWEIGDRNGRKAAGSVGTDAPTATTVMSIASASKWVYAAYVVQRAGVRDQDVPFLNFTSGYSLFGIPLCPATATVEGCLQAGNDRQNPNTMGRFFYESGHMQRHAVTPMGLGALRNAPLSAEVASVIGSHGFLYTQPQLAGGLAASANGYAGFLRRMLSGELAIGAALGTRRVCTNPRTCRTAVATPVPSTESWSYSLGHWVEDDPVTGDHAFSSPGALGFYPWIDSGKTHYGVLARRTDDLAGEGNAGFNSAACGRMIRQAWVTGVKALGVAPAPRG